MSEPWDDLITPDPLPQFIAILGLPAPALDEIAVYANTIATPDDCSLPESVEKRGAVSDQPPKSGDLGDSNAPCPYCGTVTQLIAGIDEYWCPNCPLFA